MARAAIVCWCQLKCQMLCLTPLIWVIPISSDLALKAFVLLQFTRLTKILKHILCVKQSARHCSKYQEESYLTSVLEKFTF